jgi:hypothetical protein
MAGRDAFVILDDCKLSDKQLYNNLLIPVSSVYLLETWRTWCGINNWLELELESG